MSAMEHYLVLTYEIRRAQPDTMMILFLDLMLDEGLHIMLGTIDSNQEANEDQSVDSHPSWTLSETPYVGSLGKPRDYLTTGQNGAMTYFIQVK